MSAMTVARDRTKTEHVGLIRSVKFPRDDQPQDGGHVILELTDGYTAHGPASPSQFHRGIQYRFMGRWRHDDRWGDQFHFTSFAIHFFAGQTGVVSYLSKVCEGIGERSAYKLWSQYGALAVELLRTDPDQVIRDGILREDVARAAAADLEAEKHLERTRIDLFSLLAGRGFHGRLVNQCLSKWGAKAPETIRRDPFKLLGLAGAGYRRCDKMWRDLGLPLDRLKRQLYAALNEIQNDRDGHSWLPVIRAAEAVVSAVGVDGARPKPTLKMGVRARRLTVRRDGDGAVWVALSPRAEAERRIADGIKRLCIAVDERHEGLPLWPDSIPVTQAEGDGLPSQHQADELRRAFRGAVGLYTGGPGTGKTHSLAFALRQIVASHGTGKIAACAPTGKASVRMTQALSSAQLGMRATTIHQLLEIGRNGHDGGGWGFLRNRENPLDEQFFVIDEGSMVDTALAADFFDACPDGAHVLVVGDPHQLPPVGHGAPLRDLIAAQVPTGTLTEVRRNAGRIVLACRDMKAGRPVEFSERIDLEAESPENLRLVECPAGSTADVVTKLLSQGGIKGFHPIWQTQTIVALNDKGSCSRNDLNTRLQKLLNPDGIQHRRSRFRTGDKVICLKNTWLRPCVPARSPLPPSEELDSGFYRDLPSGSEMYTANGEIGRVIAVGDTGIVCRMGEADALVRVGSGKGGKEEGDNGEGADGDDEGGKERGAIGDFDLAYAVTAHKCQGSQSPCVIVVADDAAASVAGREWWYTSVSRASKLCVIVGSLATFSRQVAKETLSRRKTFLAETIRDDRKATGVDE